MTNNLKDTLWMLAAGIRAAVFYGRIFGANFMALCPMICPCRSNLCRRTPSFPRLIPQPPCRPKPGAPPHRHGWQRGGGRYRYRRRRPPRLSPRQPDIVLSLAQCRAPCGRHGPDHCARLHRPWAFERIAERCLLFQGQHCLFRCVLRSVRPDEQRHARHS